MEKRAEEREEKFHRPECLLTDLIDFANNLQGNFLFSGKLFIFGYIFFCRGLSKVIQLC